MITSLATNQKKGNISSTLSQFQYSISFQGVTYFPQLLSRILTPLWLSYSAPSINRKHIQVDLGGNDNIENTK